MQFFILKLNAALIILLITILAAISPLRARFRALHESAFELGEAFARGVFLGAAIFHMLPDSVQGFNETLKQNSIPYAMFLCVAGFLLLYIIEKTVLHVKSKNQYPPGGINAYILALVLSIHSFITGAALGISANYAAAFIIFIAIIAHKGSESFAIATKLYQSKLSTPHILFIFSIYTFMTPAGIIWASSISTLLANQTGILLEAIFNSIAAGTFLYIATLHIKAIQTKRPMLGFVYLCLGLILMAVVSVWV